MTQVRAERVVLTGIGGALGGLIGRALAKQMSVIGVDGRGLEFKEPGIEHVQLDLRRKSAIRRLKEKRPACIVHVGVIRNPLKHKQAGEAYYFNVETTAHLLNLAEQLQVRKFIYLSSANLYGPSPRTTGYLSEDAPLHGANRSPELRDLVALDMMVQSFFWKQPNIETVILRPVHIIGPNLNNAPSAYLRLKRIPKLLGYDPLLQIIHELDVVRSIELALHASVRGIFNIVGSGQAPVSRMIQARGSQSLNLPECAFRRFLQVAFRLNLAAVPPGEVDHLKYTCLVDGSRAENELKFQPKYGLRQTINDATAMAKIPA